MDDDALRFAVGQADGPRSAVWRAWTGNQRAGKSDVYIASRVIAGIAKMSFHESGACQEGLTTQFHESLGEPTLPAGGRHIRTWTRVAPVVQPIALYSVVVMPMAMRAEPVPEADVGRVTWLPSPAPSQMSTVTLWIAPTAFLEQDATAGMLVNGALKLWGLPNGETAVLRHDPLPLPQNLVNEYERIRAEANQANQITLGEPLLEGPKRAAVFMYADNHHFVLDVPVTLIRNQ